MENTVPRPTASGPRIRLIALGDELLAGAGDARTLGWLGRAVASEQGGTAPIELFSVAIPGDSSASLAERWTEDVARRTDTEAQGNGSIEHRVVLGLGAGDVDFGVSPARSRLNLAKVLDGLERARTPAFVVGPPPTLDADRNEAIHALSGAFQDVCARRRIDYVDMIGGLDGHDQWTSDLSRTGGFPSQTGYGLMAWLVLHGGFGRWLGTSS